MSSSTAISAVKSLDTFDFPAIPSVNKALVMELARCGYIQRRENVIAVGNSGAGKTHIALGLGLAACQRGMPVGFTAAALVHELMEARDERRLLNPQRQLSLLGLLIIDELGFVPLSPTGAELIFEAISLNKWCGHLCWPVSSDFFAEHEHTRWYSFTPPQWPNMPPPLTCAGNRH